MKDCYRSYGDLRSFLFSIMPELCDDADDVIEGVSQFLVDNEYEISKYGIPEADIKDVESDVPAEEKRKSSGECCREAHEFENKVSRLNMGLFAGKLDRCPEDILREEVENK